MKNVTKEEKTDIICSRNKNSGDKYTIKLLRLYNWKLPQDTNKKVFKNQMDYIMSRQRYNRDIK